MITINMSNYKRWACRQAVGLSRLAFRFVPHQKSSNNRSIPHAISFINYQLTIYQDTRTTIQHLTSNNLTIEPFSNYQSAIQESTNSLTFALRY